MSFTKNEIIEMSKFIDLIIISKNKKKNFTNLVELILNGNYLESCASYIVLKVNISSKKKKRNWKKKKKKKKGTWKIPEKETTEILKELRKEINLKFGDVFEI